MMMMMISGLTTNLEVFLCCEAAVECPTKNVAPFSFYDCEAFSVSIVFDSYGALRDSWKR